MKILYGLLLAAVTFIVAAPSSAGVLYRADGYCTGMVVIDFGFEFDCATLPNNKVHIEAYVGNDGIVEWVSYSDHIGLSFKCDDEGNCWPIAIDTPTSFSCTVWEDYYGNRGCGDGAGGAGWLIGAPPGSFDISISDGYIIAGEGSFYFTSYCYGGCYILHDVGGVLGDWYVDEPATFALLAIGLVGLGFSRRKR